MRETFVLNSKTGEISLNGASLQSVSEVHLDVVAGDASMVTIKMAVDDVHIIETIEGEIKWET